MLSAITQLQLGLSTQARDYWRNPAVPPSPPWTFWLLGGHRTHPSSLLAHRAKGRPGSCPVLDRSSSTWSEASGDGVRLFVVKLSNLLTNLWKEGGSRGRNLTPGACQSAGTGTQCLPGPPQGSVPPGHKALKARACL